MWEKPTRGNTRTDGDFTYTDPGGSTFTGRIIQARKKLEVIPDPGALGDLGKGALKTKGLLAQQP